MKIIEFDELITYLISHKKDIMASSKFKDHKLIGNTKPLLI
jgi:hypothetical protein